MTGPMGGAAGGTAGRGPSGERKRMPPEHTDDWPITTTHLVKGEDLNHHHTLYGGRCVEWCVHMAYIAAQSCFNETRPLVFMSIRSLSMRATAGLGDMVQFRSRVDYVGESTIGVRIDAIKIQPKDDQRTVATGTFLFCTVDDEGKALPHGLPDIQPASKSAAARWEKATQSAEPSET